MDILEITLQHRLETGQIRDAVQEEAPEGSLERAISNNPLAFKANATRKP
jgi:hypothetical protein